MANTFKFGNGQWAVGKETALAYNDENNNFKPLPFSFDRASSATVVNKDGLIETVGVDEPRIDFTDNTKGHLLLEPSRQNLVTYSEDFSQSVWTKTRAAITANQAISPDGSQTADKYILDCTDNRSQISNIIYSVGTQYTTSLFVKYDSVRYFYISNAGAGAYRTVFDIENGTIISTGSSVAASKIENYGNGWYRCSATFTAAYTTLYCKLSPNSNNAAFTNTTDFSYIWGAQVEEGSYATSYIPTSGSAVTRSADFNSQSMTTRVLSVTEGTAYMELGNKPTESVYLFEMGNNSSQHRFFIYTDTNNKLKVLIVDNYSVQVDYTSSVNIGSNDKVAISYKTNEFKIYHNGVLLGTNTAGTVPPILSRLNLGANRVGTVNVAVEIKDFKLYNSVLSETELIALTTI